MADKQRKDYEFIIGHSIDEASTPVSGLNKGFTLFDVLDANNNPGSPFKKIIEASDPKYRVLKKTKTNQIANGAFTVAQADSDFTVQPNVTPRDSSHYCVSDFLTLARYIFEDSYKALDFRQIPAFLKLGPEPQSEKEHAICNYLKALHRGMINHEHANQGSEYYQLLLKAANAGHLKSRNQLITHWLFKRDRSEISERTIIEWLDSTIEADFEISQDAESNLYWANEEGVFQYPRLDKLKYMNNRYKMPSWDLKTSNLDMITVPKPKVVEFYNKLVSFMGEAFAMSLQQYKESAHCSESFLFHMTQDFSIWVHFDECTDELRVVGKSPLGNVFDKVLSIRKRKKLESFLYEIEKVIEFQFSDIDLRIGSEKLLAFAQ